MVPYVLPMVVHVGHLFGLAEEVIGSDHIWRIADPTLLHAGYGRLRQELLRSQIILSIPNWTRWRFTGGGEISILRAGNDN